MASKIPIVLNGGELSQLQSGDLLIDPYGNAIGNSELCVNGNGTDLLIGEVCYFNGGVVGSYPSVDRARANNIANAFAECICLQTVGSGLAGLFQFRGIITGLSGLTANTTYYLSTTGGVMTVTPPSTAGQYVVKLGRAITSSMFFIKIERPILLA